MADATVRVVPRPAKPKRRLRNAGMGYTTGMVVMLVILVATLLAAPRSAPPAIAEIAPQAVEQIKEAPPEQATQFGSATGDGDGELGGDGGGGGTPGTIPPTSLPPVDDDSPIEVPSVKRCIGDPPRQIEDPQSPPCVAFWKGDNGGSTWQGVTRDEILVAAPGGSGNVTQTVANFFNRRFEFYGRKIRLIDTLAEYGSDPAGQNRAATSADETHKVFASLAPGSAAVEYHTELARRQIVSTVSRPTFSTNMLERYAPYVWQYPMASDRTLAAMGEWACNRLVPGKAEFAGTLRNEDLRQRERKFGLILYSESSKEEVDPAPLERELATCGATLARVVDIDDQAGFGPWTTDVVTKLADDGITSVFCFCNVASWGAAARAATTSAYYPEWLLSTFVLNDANFYVKLNVPAEQRVRALGITQQPRQLRFRYEPAAWALMEELPGYDPDQTQSSSAYGINIAMYRPLLTLASGIQMAGPNLTPETFAKGLHAARFPNPEHENKPGKVGFNGGSYAMTIDSAEMWWSETSTGPQVDDQGSWCYVDNGERRRTGSWKKGPGLFRPPCRNGSEL